MRSELRPLVRSLLVGAPVEARVSRLVGCGLPHGGSVVVSASGVWGLAACRLGLRCGWCNVRALAVARNRFDYFVSRNEARNGWAVHHVLTVPHSRADSLASSLGELKAGMKAVTNSYQVRKLRSEYAAAPLRILDVTWGANGWHPHFHLLMLGVGDRTEAAHRFDRALTDAWTGGLSRDAGPQAVWTQEQYEPPAWVKYVTTKSRYHPKNDCRHPDHPGCKHCRPDQDGLYWWEKQGWDDAMPGKWDVPDTPGKWDVPDSPGRWDVPDVSPWDSSEPFGDMGLAALAGSKQARVLLREYVLATAGHQLVGPLRSAVRLFGEPPPGEAKEPPAVGEAVSMSSRLWGVAQLSRSVDVGEFRKAVLSGDPGLVSEVVGCRVVATKSGLDLARPVVAAPNHIG